MKRAQGMLLLKLGATLLLCLTVGAAWTSEAGRTAVERYGSIDGALAGLALSIFVTGVLFYARTLQACLTLISPAARTMEPAGVWMMFLLPYNFVEDFHIVAQAAASLRSEARLNPHLPASPFYGLVTGWGWCMAQLVSLFPGRVGETAAVVGLLLWGLHWRYLSRCVGSLRRAGANASACA